MNHFIPNLMEILKFGVISLVLCQSAHAQEEDTKIGEAQIKSTIEELAALYICSDRTLLENAGIDAQRCRTGVSLYAGTCWIPVDKLVLNYEFPANEKGRERFTSVSNVYIYCVQAELLASVIRSRANGK